ncbi:MAG TPA: hypothetical protein PLO37_02490 [Candidatus Hydrogenedentes bacterium]|nr:hypothetical protein [Candidatus Hydrogenedentota bacterium]HPG65687.1 hypothetical protein [Candidatus Hydrogenedentota bacterium]
MIERNDLLPEGAPSTISVYQLTDEQIPSSHLYMEAQVFTPDSKMFLLHRSAGPHGGESSDPEHRYLLCTLDYKAALSPITPELGAQAPSVSPDGRHCYYFVDETVVNGGKLTLKRVDLDGGNRETLLVIDAPIPGTKYRPSQLYPISTLSSDGKRLAISAFMGDGTRPDDAYGLMVFDLENPAVRVILEGQTWCNLHAQYCRSTDAAHARDIMVQENHGNAHDANGVITTLVSGDGADIHLVRDDGTDFRSFPWGRDGNEYCQGHQCWRGTSAEAITSTVNRKLGMQELVQSPQAPFAGHVGLATPGGQRNVISREFETPHFMHFATDRAGKRFVSDYRGPGGAWHLYTAEFGSGADAALENWRFILDTRSSDRAHPHPFLSPDGRRAFFNSDESGVLQAYMVVGLWEKA